jgi:hypothetical protein
MNQFCCLLAQSNTDSTKWVAILLGAFGLVYLMVLRPMMRGRKRDPLEQPAARAGLGQQRAMERDMQTLLVEYEKMIRNMTAGLDTRAARLEVLLREADEKLTELRAATGAAAASSSGGFGAGRSVENSDSPQPPVDGAVIDPKPAPTPPGPDPRHAEVYALADEGLGPTEVARRLGRPNGEIELILALRPGSE